MVSVGTPIPNSLIEAKSFGSSEVKRYFLSPDDLAEIQRKYPTIKRGNDQMLKMTKEQYLNERKAGKSRNQIVKDLKISPPVLYKSLESWGIKEQSAEQEALAALIDVASAAGDEEKADYMEEKDTPVLEVVSRSTPVAPRSIPFPTITLTFALVDFKVDAIKQRLKVQEEAGELIDELEMVNFDLTRTASELYDAGQAFIGLIRKHFQDLMVDDVDGGVVNYFMKHNQRHLDKMASKKELNSDAS